MATVPIKTNQSHDPLSWSSNARDGLVQHRRRFERSHGLREHDAEDQGAEEQEHEAGDHQKDALRQNEGRVRTKRHLKTEKALNSVQKLSWKLEIKT